VQITLEDDSLTRAATLSATLATRLCHDVAGLLGTLAGTLDLADEDPEARALAAETAQTLIARVRLLRAAWGGAAGPLDAGAIADLAEGLPCIERLRLDLAGLPGELAETPARLTLCLLLAALPGLHRGGTITLAADQDGGASMTLAGTGAAWPDNLLDCIASDAACWAATDGPRGLAAPLACLIARAAGWRIAVEGQSARILPT
jgi:histidine phosphotransferase ChpT